MDGIHHIFSKGVKSGEIKENEPDPAYKWKACPNANEEIAAGVVYVFDTANWNAKSLGSANIFVVFCFRVARFLFDAIDFPNGCVLLYRWLFFW